MIRLLSTILHINLSGAFCEAGLKKLATALSNRVLVDIRSARHQDILVVVDSIFLLTRGGDTDPDGGGADRFMVKDRQRDERSTRLWQSEIHKAKVRGLDGSHEREARV